MADSISALDSSPVTAPSNIQYLEEAQEVRWLRSAPDCFTRFLPWHSDTLIEQNMRDLLIVRRFLHDLCKNDKISYDQKYLMASQALSFLVAYREPDLVQSFNFEFPVGLVGSASYHLDKTIDLGGKKKAFGFVSDADDQPPILLYHGTFSYLGAPACVDSILADFEPEGPGFSTFRSSRENIEDWLKDKTNNGSNKAITLGHSLGATLGIYTAVFAAQYVKKATVFNAPGVNQETYEKWNENRADIEVYNVKGDFVSTKGGTHTVGRIFEGSHRDIRGRSTNEMTLHACPLFLRKEDFQYEEINQDDLANYTSDRRFPILKRILKVLSMICPFIVLVVRCTRLLSLRSTTIRDRNNDRHQVQVEELAQELYTFHRSFDSLEELRSALLDQSDQGITAQQFAYYYRRYFFHREEPHIPFKAALFIALANINRDDISEEDILDFLFHPDRCFDKSNDPDELRRVWSEIDSSTFFEAVEIAVASSYNR